ncbi:unnamed protein product [Rotaria sp. Silwood1]|nr:unnamed protein product [Rotaria sp. Silwood1]CAF3859702.1 unnamed protein product [Rotaria sp. Silwood1]CAF4717708.1 unnamed protein product [Rotaria sp. Silwood1]CAF4806055.1 unnamed protein product [Rotaria sp. Silwood1]
MIINRYALLVVTLFYKMAHNMISKSDDETHSKESRTIHTLLKHCLDILYLEKFLAYDYGAAYMISDLYIDDNALRSNVIHRRVQTTTIAASDEINKQDMSSTSNNQKSKVIVSLSHKITRHSLKILIDKKNH